jgi:hypothetical protein
MRRDDLALPGNCRDGRNVQFPVSPGVLSVFVVSRPSLLVGNCGRSHLILTLVRAKLRIHTQLSPRNYSNPD